jgi:hypothetical protein
MQLPLPLLPQRIGLKPTNKQFSFPDAVAVLNT